MKIQVVLLSLGLFGAFAVPTTNKQQIVTENDLQSKTENIRSSDKDTEQKKTTEVLIKNEEEKSPQGNFEMVIEQTFTPDDKFVVPSEFDDIPETSFVDNNLYRNLANNVARDPDEIMETAAGFIPVPIFRRRQQARRRFSHHNNRRYFRKNPYYTPYYMYPYVGFYRPSSLRYY